MSEPQGTRLGPFRKASPKGQLCLVKEVYSLLLREVGWVCTLAEEQRRSGSAVNCHRSMDSAY